MSGSTQCSTISASTNLPTMQQLFIHSLIKPNTIHVLLNRDSLDDYSRDRTLTAGQRAVAKEMYDNFRAYAYASGKPFGGSFITNNFLSIEDDDIAEIDDKAKLLPNSQRTSELGSTQEFARVAKAPYVLQPTLRQLHRQWQNGTDCQW